VRMQQIKGRVPTESGELVESGREKNGREPQQGSRVASIKRLWYQFDAATTDSFVT